ncbi:MAG: NAD-dependent dihydropyrimidine dehydrogenase subunit PreA [Candidatus Eisenbacteria bacterium]|nr:NAD-dependent dihydropyrimidine dehydrogenase subunit PreA [Candidatus Eisenbacteria bacterium]
MTADARDSIAPGGAPERAPDSMSEHSPDCMPDRLPDREAIRRAGLAHEAHDEAWRCLLCEDPPCRAGCPAGIDPRRFIRRIRFGDLAGAARHLRDRNILAGSCADLCPAEELCVGRCLREKLSMPIDIPALQRFVCEWERLRGRLPVARAAARGPRVAIVGAGPAGLACAADLARRGCAVEVFERSAEPGGLARFVIPGSRLKEDTLARDLEIVRELGVEFHFGEEIASASALKEAGFATVFVATGADRALPLRIAGEGHPRVRPALAYLREARAGRAPVLGARVVVIGGGNTAIDAARVVRASGREAIVLYRRGPEEMPAYAREVAAALREGVELLFRVMPVEFLADAPASSVDGLRGVRLQRVRWIGSGRAAKRYEAEGVPFDFPCDDALVAAGAVPASPLDLATERAGTIRVDRISKEASLPGVFAGGDAVTGPATVVAAVGEGNAAAQAIASYLQLEGSGVGERSVLHRPPRARLQVRFLGRELENPFLLAAGPPSDDLEMTRAALRAGWAGAVLKTTTVPGTVVSLVHPMMSAPFEDRGRLNAMGNIDLISEHDADAVAERLRALKREFPAKRIAASIMGADREQWAALARLFETAGADWIECSFSCPQGTLGSAPGAMLGQDPALVRTVAAWVKEAVPKTPVVIKITPQVADIAVIARAVEEAGCDGICASNTLPSLTGIDLDSWTPCPDVAGASTYSGLSGPAIKPVTLRAIAEIARTTRLPVTGTGGPLTWRDAVEFLLAGATTVQFCTAVMRYGFDIIDDLCEGLAEYLDRRDLATPEALIGGALSRLTTHEKLARRAVKARIDPALCIGDGACFVACRDGGHRAIRMRGDRVCEVDRERCVGCGLCPLVCPVPGCIALEPAQEEGSG